MSKVAKVVKLGPPSWQATVQIIAMILENPEADPTAKAECKAELIRLARIVDNVIKTEAA